MNPKRTLRHLLAQLQEILDAVECIHDLLLDSMPEDEQLDVIASMDGPEMMPVEEEGHE